MKIAIVPGSFDPITNGHIDIVKRAASVYDKVYLAVMINPSKEYTFTISERTDIARDALLELPNVEVISSEGMLWELARDLSAVAIVKGYRNNSDLEYERKMAEFNSAHYPQAKTVLLKADDSLAAVSSTLVRERLRYGKSLCGLLPPRAIDKINKIISNKEL